MIGCLHQRNNFARRPEGRPRSGLINRKCLAGHWGPIPPPSSQNHSTAARRRAYNGLVAGHVNEAVIKSLLSTPPMR
jgi:hypothetical protein